MELSFEVVKWILISCDLAAVAISSWMIERNYSYGKIGSLVISSIIAFFALTAAIFTVFKRSPFVGYLNAFVQGLWLGSSLAQGIFNFIDGEIMTGVILIFAVLIAAVGIYFSSVFKKLAAVPIIKSP